MTTRGRVHLDHNATTAVRPEVRDLQRELEDELLGNPSSLHASGRRARTVIDLARERVAVALGLAEDGIVFTPSGTAANNLAILGRVRAAGPRAGLVTTAVEHSSVLGPAEALATEGRTVARAEVGRDGTTAPEAVVDLVLEGPEVALVSVQSANNEVGSTPDLLAIVQGLRERFPSTEERPAVHTDAVQALGRVPLRLAEVGVDLATFSAHKVGGPLGVGVLWRRPGTSLAPLLHGGDQESALWPGTENAAAIGAAALAIELAAAEAVAEERRLRVLARSLWSELERTLPGVRLLGPDLDSPRRLPNTLCVAVPGADGKVLVTRLDLEGLEVSAGSACASGSLEPSHVLLAMGCDRRTARSALRLSLGRSTGAPDCARAVEILGKALAGARAT